MKFSAKVTFIAEDNRDIYNSPMIETASEVAGRTVCERENKLKAKSNDQM